MTGAKRKDKRTNEKKGKEISKKNNPEEVSSAGEKRKEAEGFSGER
jgi:hypothetical protein